MTPDFLRLGWVRHGQTEWNRKGKIQGSTDIPLDEEGKRQARLLAERLAAERWLWNGVVSSPLKRAAETARILADRLSLPLLWDERLKERSFGSAEGTTLEQRLERWGPEWRKQVADMESDDSLRARGRSFVEDWLRERPGESWLVVTHGGLLARVVRMLCPSVDDPVIRNGSLTVMEHTQGKWRVLVHNCTAHLQTGELERKWK